MVSSIGVAAVTPIVSFNINFTDGSVCAIINADVFSVVAEGNDRSSSIGDPDSNMDVVSMISGSNVPENYYYYLNVFEYRHRQHRINTNSLLISVAEARAALVISVLTASLLVIVRISVSDCV